MYVVKTTKNMILQILDFPQTINSHTFFASFSLFGRSTCSDFREVVVLVDAEISQIGVFRSLRHQVYASMDLTLVISSMISCWNDS